MNIKQLRAIEQVLLMNNDICKLYEKRGVTREELRTVFTLAAGRIKPWKDLNDTEEELPEAHEDVLVCICGGGGPEKVDVAFLIYDKDKRPTWVSSCTGNLIETGGYFVGLWSPLLEMPEIE
jgi:hypothetical protein